jgi:glycosyltransferase involved in cell wall biosynthesis
MKKIFNYIVPIFNKEDILPETLKGIEKCSSKDSKIILVVDGCTDKSEQIVDEFIARNVRKTVKLIMPNVHMLLSVNEGLKHIEEGFSIIMQDDIILEDIDMENKIYSLYERIENLGMISLRYGLNLKKANFTSQIKNGFKGLVDVCDTIQGQDDYAAYLKGDYGKFYPRMCAINGPNVIPWELYLKIGKFDENLAPYGYDDPEYCIRALKLNFINGLFPIKYTSEEEWGGTRRSKAFIREANRILTRNRLYVWKKHKVFLKQYLKNNIMYKSNETL